jgi:GH35 family endo-1,4-beta-xylanase
MDTQPKRAVLRLFAGLGAAMLAFAAAVAVGQTSGAVGAPAAAPATAPVVDQHGPTIKDTYAKCFLIGMAGDLPANYSDVEIGLVKENFGVVTPENCMKPGPVHPAEGTWSFERPDALVKWCEENHIALHGHTLVWHSQTANWFFDGGDKETVTRRLKEHISTLVGRYKGKVRSWDVVNEAINDGGNAETGKTENLRNSRWLQTLGPEFLTLAFKFAHEADPEAKLYYNDYSIEIGPKHASSMVLLKRLIKDGAPIYGVGIQGHWSTATVPYAAIDKAIADYTSLGLKVSISELDVTIRGASGGQLGGPGRGGFGGGAPGGGPAPATQPGAGGAAASAGAAPGAPATRPFGRGGFGAAGRGGPVTPPSPQDLQAQADAYARIFSIFAKHKDAVERVTFWGLSDRRTWRFGQNPLIFDANNQRKLAYVAIVDALQHPKPYPAPAR